MTRSPSLACVVLTATILAAGSASSFGAEIRLLTRKPDPYGSPRPGAGEEHVPLGNSFYLQLAVDRSDEADHVLPESISIRLEAQAGQSLEILRPGIKFAPEYSGRLFAGKDRRAGRTLVVYVDSQRRLEPATTYTIQVRARSSLGASLPAEAGSWQFTTEAEPATHRVDFQLNFNAPPVRWTGAFFSGFCKPSFCTSYSNRVPSYELMDQVRKTAPRAWSLQRDFWMTGMEIEPTLLAPNLPGIVRERQTRRIVSIDSQGDNTVLQVEDFFGHQQYGIEPGRALSADYHAGDAVLIADRHHDARAKVVSVDDRAGTVLVSRFEEPEGGWKLAYSAPLPSKEDPNAPGLFPPGGCHLRKFNPPGTPVYYWGRLDREWDLAHRRFRRRLMPNFADAPGDLSIDGRNWTTAKDYAELHEVTRQIAGHIIDRYGDAALDFPWSVFNEPDLGVLFWRSDWTELQKFYDYTVDGILRAFEDRGYDSERVFVGGLELGAIFGTNLRLREFLAHCSPRATAKGALPLNAAFADPRLDGKRSRRVEKLCGANQGRGAPCDFVSIHAYNTSKLMAAKLIRAKEMALQIDPEYYADLWVNSHESCPGWDMPPDPAFGDSYLGNGYFPTWCADVARRLLDKAGQDPRFAYGETILTFWPWPNTNFDGGNACTRTMHVDDDGDGKTDRTVAVAMPILHFLGLLSSMGSDYWVLPEERVGAHVVSGLAGRTRRRVPGDDVRVLLYSHHDLDTQSRSENQFQVTLHLTGLPEGQLQVKQFRFDKDHNSYYRLGRSLREKRIADSFTPGTEAKQAIEAATRLLESDEADSQLQAVHMLAELGPAAKPATSFLVEAIQNTEDDRLRAEATGALWKINSPQPYPADVVRKVEELSTLRSTGSSEHAVDAEGNLRLSVPIAANGANFLVIGGSPSP